MTRADIRSVACNCNNTLLSQSLRFSYILEQLVRSMIGVVVVAVVGVVVVVVAVVVVVVKQTVVHITSPVKKKTPFFYFISLKFKILRNLN